MKQNKRYQDDELEQQSKTLKKLKVDIESCQKNEKREAMKKRKKEVKTGIKKRIKQIEEEQLENKLKEIENMKDDSTRCFAAIKDLTNNRKQKPLIVKNENGKVETSEEEQIKLISDHFKKMLAPESQNGNFKEYNPKKI